MNNRELATVLWASAVVVAILVGCALNSNLRSSVGGVLRAVLTPVIVVPFVMMVVYCWGVVRLAIAFGFWNQDHLLTDTFFWFLTSAIVLFFNVADAGPGFVRRKALQVFGATVLVEFLMNLFVMNLILEILLQPWVFLWMGIELVARNNPEQRPAVRAAGFFLSATGIGIASYRVIELVENWRSAFSLQTGLKFALPIWMTLGILPFIYLLALYVAYDKALRYIKISATSARARLRVSLALITSIFGRDKLQSVSWMTARRAAEEGSFREARRAFRQSVITSAS